MQKALGPLRLTQPSIFYPSTPGRLLDVLSRQLPYLKREHLAWLTQTGAVYVNNWRIMTGITGLAKHRYLCAAGSSGKTLLFPEAIPCCGQDRLERLYYARTRELLG